MTQPVSFFSKAKVDPRYSRVEVHEYRTTVFGDPIPDTGVGQKVYIEVRTRHNCEAFLRTLALRDDEATKEIEAANWVRKEEKKPALDDMAKALIRRKHEAEAYGKLWTHKVINADGTEDHMPAGATLFDFLSIYHTIRVYSDPSRQTFKEREERAANLPEAVKNASAEPSAATTGSEPSETPRENDEQT